MMEYDVKATGDSEVARAITQSISDVLTGISRQDKIAVKTMRKTITRSLAKSGSTLRMAIKKGMQGDLQYPDRAVYPEKGYNIARMLSANRPKGARVQKGLKPRKVRGGVLRAGKRLAGAMRYGMFDGEQSIAIGLLEPSMIEGRHPASFNAEKAKLWRHRFKMWQEEGEIDISGYPRASERSMFAYFRVLDMPITKHPRRPARPVISAIETREQPSRLFEKMFLERLNR